MIQSRIEIHNSEKPSNSSSCKLIGKSKYEVYKYTLDEKAFAMKVFPSENKSDYETEASFSHLCHPNILVASKLGTWITKNEEFSLIFTEFCEISSFSDFLKARSHLFNEKMDRTSFRQLVEAVEYLHKNKASHLDIKLENILLDEDFNLKLADYDLAHTKGKPKRFHGSLFYRAPEEKNNRFSPEAVDVFQMGIVLFVMRIGGKRFPYGKDFENLDFMQKSPKLYWAMMIRSYKSSDDEWSPEIRELFEKMTKKDTSERATIEDIKKSKWYQGEVYTQKEVKSIFDNVQMT